MNEARTKFRPLDQVVLFKAHRQQVHGGIARIWRIVLIMIMLFSVLMEGAMPAEAQAKSCEYGNLGGLILDRWRELGGPNSQLGCPLTANEEVVDGPLPEWPSAGQLRRFENGQGALSPWTGSESVVFAWREGDQIKVRWRHTWGYHYDFWIVRWNVNGVYEDQDDVPLDYNLSQPRSEGQFTYPHAQRHYLTYTFLVEGCDRDADWTNSRAVCNQGWMVPVSVGPTEEPPPPTEIPIPPDLTPIADLVAGEPRVDLHGEYIHYHNELFTFLFPYCNTGTKDTGTFTILLFENRGTSAERSDSYNTSLAPGACETGYWPNLSLPAGDHTLEAFLDSDGAVLEANEANNSFYDGIIVDDKPYTTISANNGGSLLLNAGGIRLDFPASAVTTPVTVTYTRQDTPAQPVALGSNTLRSFTLEAQTSDGQPVTQFQRPYTMTVGYAAADLMTLGLSEASLKLAFWDTTNSHWVTVPTNVDAVNHSVTANLDHFTEFALFGNKHLDDFNRLNGPLGSSWSGHTEGGDYKIRDQQLRVHIGDPGMLYWQPDIFGSAQEAFVTLTRLDKRTKGDDARQSVLLKVQGAIPNTINGAIEVRYYAQAQKVRVQSRLPGQNWQVLAQFPASFADGDQLGARALADGHVQVFRNGLLIGEAQADAFFANIGGRIGMRCIDARNTLLDDFGGGDVR
jgi:hypothetical protein